MAGGAQDIGSPSARDTVLGSPNSGGNCRPAVIRYELIVRGACGHDKIRIRPGYADAFPHDRIAIFVDRRGIRSYRVIVVIVPSGCSILAEQRRDWVAAVGRLRDQTDPHLIDGI